MALLEDLVKSPNLWIGIGVALAAPVVLPVIGAVVRPLAKAVIKGYLATAEVLTPVVASAAGQVRERLAAPIAPVQDRIEAAKQALAEETQATAGETPALAVPNTVKAAPVPRRPRKRRPS